MKKAVIAIAGAGLLATACASDPDKEMKALFKAHGAERTMDFIVGREVYSHVERVLDRLEDVADEIQGIVIDHA